MDVRVLLILTLAGILTIGATKAAHGVVRGGKAVRHAIVRVVHHQR